MNIAAKYLDMESKNHGLTILDNPVAAAINIDLALSVDHIQLCQCLETGLDSTGLSCLGVLVKFR